MCGDGRGHPLGVTYARMAPRVARRARPRGVARLPAVLQLESDLPSLAAASRVALKQLAAELAAISQGLDRVARELEMAREEVGEGGEAAGGGEGGPGASGREIDATEHFADALERFLCGAEARTASLATQYAEVVHAAESLALYFGEDPSTCSVESIMGTLHSFTGLLSKAAEENRQQRAAAEEKAREEEKRQALKHAGGAGVGASAPVTCVDGAATGPVTVLGPVDQDTGIARLLQRRQGINGGDDKGDAEEEWSD